MHEFAITEELIKLILEESKKNNVKTVLRVKVVLGKLTGFVASSIKYYFDILKTDYEVLKEAEIDFEEKKGLFKCEDCGLEFYSDSFFTTCPNCEGFNFRSLTGEEFYIDCLEVDCND